MRSELPPSGMSCETEKSKFVQVGMVREPAGSRYT